MDHDQAVDTSRGGVSPEVFMQTRNSAQFEHLRQTFRRFAFPMAATFFLWYLLYVVSATFFTDFMKIKLYENINVALVFGLLQFVTTGLFTWAYVRFANNKLDPESSAIREQLEG